MASEALPSWKSLSQLNEHGVKRGPLVSALLTTFDPPDPSLLIEEYLPVWLGLDNSFAEEGIDRLRYFAELEDALHRLKGQIAIVSSAGEVATSAEGWIWNYIRRFEVGALGAAVQHAKLWMFLRGPASHDSPETLELVISSANLTRDGQRGQIQAGWRCVLPLFPKTSKSRTVSWGILPSFLVELGNASGTSAASVMERWLVILGRASCPADVGFIASVPGTHSAATIGRRQSAWGVAGLRAAWSGGSKPRINAMVPTIGRWTDRSIQAWTSLAQLEPSRLSVAWVRLRHPWAQSWQLDRETEATLTRTGVRWLELQHRFDNEWESPLCDEHQKSDTRWSHAKLYELREGRRLRLLITSANFSRSAWGDPQSDGGLHINNFELGVLIPIQDGFRDRLHDGAFDRATSEIDYVVTQEPQVAWLAAEWDGDELTVDCRTTSDSKLDRYVEVTVARAHLPEQVSVSWTQGANNRAIVSWRQCKGVPVLVSVRTQNGYTRYVAVTDVRSGDNTQILCGEFDELLISEALDALIEEKYGYMPASGSNDRGGEVGAKVGTTAGADYGVPAYVDARRRFRLVDNWWREICDADDRIRPFILKDGRRIQGRWSAVANSSSDPGLRLAAKVAADELAHRIQRFA